MISQRPTAGTAGIIRRLFFVAVIVFTLTSCSSTPPTPNPTPTASKTTPAAMSAQMYYVGDTPTGFKLFSEKYSLAGVGLPAVTKLVADLLDGTAKPMDPDYSNLWGKGTSLLSLKVVPPLATVDLHLGILNVGSEAELRAIDEIFWTIASFDPQITQMNLLVDGKKTDSLAGHVDASKTFTLQPAFDVLSPLQISSIREGESLTNPITISGEACTFEANVVWKLSKDGVLLKSGAETAQEACPTRSKWTLKLGELARGSYQLSVVDYSAKDGSLIAQDTKNFKVV